jgi:hypothetical protein
MMQKYVYYRNMINATKGSSDTRANIKGSILETPLDG